jgi:hypothetical protein
MLYFFNGMDEPRAEPRNDGKSPKYEDERIIQTVEEAQRIKYTVYDNNNIPVEVPGSMFSRPNKSYLGHTSDVFITPWLYEDRSTLNDPFFRRIPNQSQRKRFYSSEEQEEMLTEIARLAAIENPGRCMERRRRFDGWCTMHPMLGGLRCYWHTPSEQRKTMRKRTNTVKQQRRADRILRKTTER